MPALATTPEGTVSGGAGRFNPRNQAGASRGCSCCSGIAGSRTVRPGPEPPCRSQKSAVQAPSATRSDCCPTRASWRQLRMAQCLQQAQARHWCRLFRKDPWVSALGSQVSPIGIRTHHRRFLDLNADPIGTGTVCCCVLTRLQAS